MIRPTRPFIVLVIGGTVLLSVCTFSSGALAAEDDAFSGTVLFGWRFADVGGSQNKYDQHIGLDEGARLFGLDLGYRPSSRWVDRVELKLDSLGGEPYESLDLKIRKFGRYELELGRRESHYFYQDVLLPPELASARLSTGGDFHHFDFDRVREFAKLEVTLNPRATFGVTLDRFSKKGESTTTLDIQRDEFEFDRPIDETMDQLGASFQYGWEHATLRLQETVRRYDNASSIFLPGQSLGEDPTNSTVLDFYFLDQPTDIRSEQHLASLVVKPVQRMVLRLAATLQDLELETSVRERSQGIGFRGSPFTTEIDGSGGIERDLELFDADLSYGITDRVAIVAGARRHELDQDGALLFGDDLGASRWRIDTDSFDLGVEVAVLEDLTVAVGVLAETRDARGVTTEDDESHAHEEETDNTGYYVTLGWEPIDAVRINFEAEEASYDDPFTLVSPTDRLRLRLTADYSFADGFFAKAVYRGQDVDNDNSGWDADFDSLTLRGGFRSRRLNASVGYSFVDVERSILQVIDEEEDFIVPVFFESSSDFVDGRLWLRANDRLTLGADLRLYENDGDFGLERDDFRIYANLDLIDNYLLHLAYRAIDYEETDRGLNDYDADLIEVGFGVRF